MDSCFQTVSTFVLTEFYFKEAQIMKETNNVVSVEFEVIKRIDLEVQELVNAGAPALPEFEHPLTADYVRRIEGQYNVGRSKQDTDNAIDLLYIAYNTTPQKYAAIRNDIEALVMKVISTQANSERKMSGIVREAGSIDSALKMRFEEWTQKRGSADTSQIKIFIEKKLVVLARKIKEKAEDICEGLNEVVREYDEIIKATTDTTRKSQNALSQELANREESEKDIASKTAEQAKIDSMVRSLESEIDQYQKMADDFRARAETAEERAFIMSVVQVGAQMITAMTPTIMAGITGAATGGASIIASTACSTASGLLRNEKAATESASATDVIKTKKEIAEKDSQKSTAEAEKADLEEKANVLAAEKKKIEEDTDADEDIRAANTRAVDKRISDNEAAIKEENKKISATIAAIEALNASLKVLDEKMGRMSEKQEQAASGLREMQMKMLENVREYVKEKHKQEAELAQITVLLRSARSKDETIQLSIQSLNLSLKALNKMREIIIEISGFFKSFADFMQSVLDNSDIQIEFLGEALSDNEFDDALFIKRIVQGNDEFFITQAAEWRAIQIVSAKFKENFHDGLSKLNSLKGNYLYGSELDAYLRSAADKIDEIVASRNKAVQEKMLELDAYRDRINIKA